MRKIYGIAIFLIFVINISALKLDLKKAEELAIKNNLELQSQTKRLKATKHDYFNSFISLFPSGNFTSSYRKNVPENVIENPAGDINFKDTKSYGYSISQPIFVGGKIFLGYRNNKKLYEIEKQNMKSEILNTISEVKSKFFTILENKKLLEIAQKNLKISKKNLEIAEFKYQNGSIAKADLLKLKSDAANKNITLIQTGNQYSVSISDLKYFLNLKEDIEIEDVDFQKYSGILNRINNLTIDQSENYLNEIIRISKKSNPNIQKAKLAKEINSNSLKIARGNFLPSVNLSFDKSWSKPNYEDNFSNSGTLMLSASIPFFPIIDNSTSFYSTKHKYLASKKDLESAKNSISLVIRNLYYNWITTAKSIEASKLALEYAKETYEQMQARFQSNIISSTELLASEIGFINAQNTYTKSKYNFLRIQANLIEQSCIQDKQLNKILNKRR